MAFEQRLSEGLHALEARYWQACASWLPTAAAFRVSQGACACASGLPAREQQQVLEFGSNDVDFRGVPGHMPRLEAVMLINFTGLSWDWLPLSSRERVRIICIYNSNAVIPDGMRSLQTVCVPYWCHIAGYCWF